MASPLYRTMPRPVSQPLVISWNTRTMPHAVHQALVRTRAWWTACGIVLVFQLITNGWLTGRGIVRYSGDAILGSGRIVFLGDGRIAYAPVEDLAFGFALVLLSCAGWVWTGARTRSAHGGRV